MHLLCVNVCVYVCVVPFDGRPSHSISIFGRCLCALGPCDRASCVAMPLGPVLCRCRSIVRAIHLVRVHLVRVRGWQIVRQAQTAEKLTGQRKRNIKLQRYRNPTYFHEIINRLLDLFAMTLDRLKQIHFASHQLIRCVFVRTEVSNIVPKT